MNRSLRNLTWVLLVLLGLSPAMAQENGWPRTVSLDQGTVTIYEPQVDEMSDDFIKFRAALAYREKPGAEPVFGAGWFESEVQVDRFSRTVHPVDMKVTQTRFPVEADVQSALSTAMAQPSFASNFTFSLDDLEASMKAAQAEAQAAEKLKTTPPKIIYRDSPALLVTIDGEPVLREVENSRYEAVINTPYPLIRDGERFYLNVAEGVWYRSNKATGPYRFVDKVPEEISVLVKPDEEVEGSDESRATLALTEKVTPENAPEIVISTEPAELIVTEGPAAFVPLVDDLLVLNNSDDDVFMDLAEQEYYTVLAGRWYRSKSLDGPWVYQESGELPAAFTRIPQESDQADSRVYVAGTEEAEEAVLDAQVPQTAAIKRGEADVEVQYDGEPVFAPVDGTDMVFANNTGSTVILANGLYYLVEDGVWYVSASYNGPWQVAVARPDQVRVILPSSPVYNVKYVYVYDYTPNVVYVGYTPGYLGSYVYHNTVFYGSGWYYRPWVSPYWYYPRYRTWGFHVRYDPWYGWNFGLSWAWGPFSFSYWPGGHWHHHHHWHHRHYSYWGPHGYRPRHHHYRSPHHRPPGHGGGNRPHPYERHHNLYRDGKQRALIAETRDNPPRSYDRRRGDSAFVSKAYAGKGDKQKFLPKGKDAGYKAKPVSRTDLAVKARTQDSGFKAGRDKVVSSSKGKAYSKAYTSKVIGNRALKTPDRKLTRNDLAVKANSSDRNYKASQKKAVPVTAGKTAGKSLRTPDYKLNRKDLANVKVSGSKSKTQPSSRSKTKYAAPQARKVVQTSSQKPYVQRSAKVSTPASSGKTSTRSYSKPKSTPIVKLTRPSTSPSSYSKARPSTAPATRSQQRPQYSHTSAPKLQSAPKQSFKAPPRTAPQKSSKQAAPARSKQRKVK